MEDWKRQRHIWEGEAEQRGEWSQGRGTVADGQQVSDLHDQVSDKLGRPEVEPTWWSQQRVQFRALGTAKQVVQQILGY